MTGITKMIIKATPPLLAFLIMISLLSACSSQYGDTDLSRHAVLTMSDPQLKITRVTPLTWYADLSIHNIEPSDETFEIAGYIQNLIAHSLINKGFNILADQKVSQYQLVAVAMVGNNEANTKILELFKLFPGLAVKDSYQQGTLLVAIVDVKQRKAAWRGSVQMFIDPDLPKDIRLERINGSVTRLLDKLTPDI